jgi:hypothetical protein
MVFGSRPKIPQDRLIVLGQESKAIGFILRPRTDMRRRDIAHIIHIEAKQRAHLRVFEQCFDAVQAFAAQAFEVNALLPIHCHGSIGFDRH